MLLILDPDPRLMGKIGEIGEAPLKLMRRYLGIAKIVKAKFEPWGVILDPKYCCRFLR